jgi:hypothetical protein
VQSRRARPGGSAKLSGLSLDWRPSPLLKGFVTSLSPATATITAAAAATCRESAACSSTTAVAVSGIGAGRKWAWLSKVGCLGSGAVLE